MKGISNRTKHEELIKGCKPRSGVGELLKDVPVLPVGTVSK